MTPATRLYAAIAAALIVIALGAFLIGRASSSDEPAADSAPAQAAEPEERTVKGLSNASTLPPLRTQSTDSSSSATDTSSTTTTSTTTAPSSSTTSTPTPSNDSGNEDSDSGVVTGGGGAK